MLIYSQHIGPRFSYAVKMVFRHYADEVRIVSDKAAFDLHNGPKLCYATTSEATVCSVMPSPHLWNNEVQTQEVSIRFEESIPFLFIADSNAFDVFAATFFMLSRYEEYLQTPRDQHGRFKAINAVCEKYGVLHLPVVDMWRFWFERKISTHFPEVKFENRRYTSELTIDVDSAFAYRNKGFYRTAGGFGKDIVSFKWKNLFHRLSSLLHISEDVYETYDYIISVAAKNDIPVTWFFLLSDFNAHDINVPHTNVYFRKLIQRIAKSHRVGIHPGYASNTDQGKLNIEVKRLEEIVEKRVTDSRQHFLILQFPETYRRLVQQDIRNDYTMGYAEATGFRAGTSLEFPWFDLQKNEPTSLIIHPFVAMDTTLNKYLGLSPDESIQRCRDLNQVIRKTEGNYCLLWHNETLSEKGIWKDWRRVFESVFLP